MSRNMSLKNRPRPYSSYQPSICLLVTKIPGKKCTRMAGHRKSNPVPSDSRMITVSTALLLTGNITQTESNEQA